MVLDRFGCCCWMVGLVLSVGLLLGWLVLLAVCGAGAVGFCGLGFVWVLFC
jgi:hypothetical protein